MLQRKAATDKLLVLGCDAMDPRLTRKYVDMGIMPNMKKYIERGACREDLVLLGGHPTVTPPMWTTLATGCYANVHGITGFYRCGSDIDLIDYNMDSRLCKAEQVWNCFAEAGKKTLVWHWPGSSWPPSSDSENLFVVDGTSPGTVGMSTAYLDAEFFVAGNEEIKEVRYVPAAPIEASSACVITDLELDDVDADGFDFLGTIGATSQGMRNMVVSKDQMATSATEALQDLVQTPIKPASGWANAPEDAKEFTILLSRGLIRRPALILKNKDGIYDSVAVYKTKKDTNPLVVLPLGKMVPQIIDDCFKNDKKYRANRSMKLLKLAEDGSSLMIYISGAMDTENDEVWHPRRLFKEITENIGYPVPCSIMGRQDTMQIVDCMISAWYEVNDWQAKSILHLIETEDLDVVFSHYHAIDLENHSFIKHLAERPFNRNPVSVALKWEEEVYKEVDDYLGKFLHLLDEGWTIIITSDHGQVAPKYDLPVLIEASGTSIPYMEQLGYTVTYKDEDGNLLIDWTKTKAVLQREGHIYLNLKGRNKHTLPDGTVIDGIVDPADQWELEEEIMTRLYELKDEESGHRLVGLALRNRDSVLLGQGGPEAGDIMIWHAEGYNFDHDDCISTTWGENDTSVSPIFVAAGKGIKQGVYTDRIIRQIDVAPTCCVLGGVRMPAQCEGAPAYQILEDEY